jgi:hypothetical protein
MWSALGVGCAPGTITLRGRVALNGFAIWTAFVAQSGSVCAVLAGGQELLQSGQGGIPLTWETHTRAGRR